MCLPASSDAALFIGDRYLEESQPGRQLPLPLQETRARKRGF